jgi:hypothetical protein
MTIGACLLHTRTDRALSSTWELTRRDAEEISVIFDTGRTGNAEMATARMRRAAQTNANAEVRSIREDYGGKNDSDSNTPIESLPN